MSIWGWQDFSYVSGKSKMDSRRAAFQVFDFINEFGIEQFQVVSSNGDWQNQRIEIVYKVPEGYTHDKIDDLWYLELQKWVEAH